MINLDIEFNLMRDMLGRPITPRNRSRIEKFIRVPSVEN